MSYDVQPGHFRGTVECDVTTMDGARKKLGITMRDVAKLAGVSIGTVSNVLNHQVGVSPENREKVLAAVEKLGYQRNELARNFRRKETLIIGLIIPDISNPFFPLAVKGVEDEAKKYGYHVVICNTNWNIEEEKEHISSLIARRADGIILATVGSQKAHLVWMRSNRVPFVLFPREIEGLDVPCVRIDNIQASMDAMNYLIGLGHRRIAFINSQLTASPFKLRLQGYILALSENGIPIDETLIKQGFSGLEGGFNATKELLAASVSNSLPTAIFAANDLLAIGAMRAVKAAKMRVPEDIAVVGMDDIPMSSFVEPPLTTIAQPTYEMGVAAVDLLHELMVKTSYAVRKVVLPHRLVIRESTNG